MVAKRKSVDRERLELDYRAGIKTFREMATDHGISAPRVKQIATEEKWTRDLTKRVKAAAEDKLNKTILNNKLNAGRKKASEKELVESISDDIVIIRLAHRSDIGSTRDLFRSLLTECKAETGTPELFESIAQLLDTSGPDQTGTWRQDKLNEIYKKVISTPGRIESAKKLTEMLEKLVKLERQAFGITDGEDEKEGFDMVIKSLGAKLRAELAD
jgi:hypothetical protein